MLEDSIGPARIEVDLRVLNVQNAPGVESDRRDIFSRFLGLLNHFTAIINADYLPVGPHLFFQYQDIVSESTTGIENSIP